MWNTGRATLRKDDLVYSAREDGKIEIVPRATPETETSGGE